MYVIREFVQYQVVDRESGTVIETFPSYSKNKAEELSNICNRIQGLELDKADQRDKMAKSSILQS